MTNLVLPEEVLEPVWDEDDNGGGGLVHDNLLGSSDVEVLEVWAKLLVVDLEINKGLGDLRWWQRERVTKRR